MYWKDIWAVELMFSTRECYRPSVIYECEPNEIADMLHQVAEELPSMGSCTVIIKYRDRICGGTINRPLSPEDFLEEWRNGFEEEIGIEDFIL